MADSHLLPSGASSITTGGASQTLFAANERRRLVFIQNTSAGDLWVDFAIAAVLASPSVKIPAGAELTMTEVEGIDTRAINIIGATTGQTFSAKEA